jgi:hypothetical protein
MDALIHQHTFIVLNAFFLGMDSQPNFICFGSHVFPGSRYNEIFVWRTWHTLVANDLLWMCILRDFFWNCIQSKLTIAHGSHVFYGIDLSDQDKISIFFLHNPIEVFTKRMVRIDHLHIQDVILKLYAFKPYFS